MAWPPAAISCFGVLARSPNCRLPISRLAISGVGSPVSRPWRTTCENRSDWSTAMPRNALLTTSPLGSVMVAPWAAVRLNVAGAPCTAANRSSLSATTLICVGSVVTTLCANCGLISTVRTASRAPAGNARANWSATNSDCNCAMPCSSIAVSSVLSPAQVASESLSCAKMPRSRAALTGAASSSIVRSWLTASMMMSLYALMMRRPTLLLNLFRSMALRYSASGVAIRRCLADLGGTAT